MHYYYPDLYYTFSTDTCRRHDAWKCSLTECDLIISLITLARISPRTSPCSGSRRNQRCFSEPTLTTSIRPSSTMRSTTPSACWRRPWTWSPPPPSGSLSPGSTDTTHHPCRSTSTPTWMLKLWTETGRRKLPPSPPFLFRIIPLCVDNLWMEKKLMTQRRDFTLPLIQQPQRHTVVYIYTYI